MSIEPEILDQISHLLQALGWRPRKTFPVCLVDRKAKAQIGVLRVESLQEAPVNYDILRYDDREYLVKRRVVVLKKVEYPHPTEIDHIHVDMDPL
jgi:hypothetical protein